MPATPIANDIRRLRFERGEMTQQALADGVTRQTIIALEGALRVVAGAGVPDRAGVRGRT